MQAGQTFREFFQVAVISGGILGILIRIGNKDTSMKEALTYILSFIILFCLIRLFLE